MIIGHLQVCVGTDPAHTHTAHTQHKPSTHPAQTQHPHNTHSAHTAHPQHTPSTPTAHPQHTFSTSTAAHLEVSGHHAGHLARDRSGAHPRVERGAREERRKQRNTAGLVRRIELPDMDESCTAEPCMDESCMDESCTSCARTLGPNPIQNRASSPLHLSLARLPSQGKGGWGKSLGRFGTNAP